jgi:hypothetical protein
MAPAAKPLKPAPALASPPPQRLYFKSLSWLRILFVWLALGSVPFIVIITSSKFTSPALAIRDGMAPAAGTSGAAAPADWDAPETGVKKYNSVSGGRAVGQMLALQCFAVQRAAKTAEKVPKSPTPNTDRGPAPPKNS